MTSERDALQAIVQVSLSLADGSVSSQQRAEFSRSMQLLKPRFRTLLSRPPPKPEDKLQVQRKQVQLPDGTVTPLNDLDEQIALKMSEDYNLNELECVRLLLDAHLQFTIARRPPKEILQLCGGLFFSERKTVLDALCTLFQLAVVELNVDSAICKESLDYLKELLGGDFRKRILFLINELNREDANGVGAPSAEPEVMDSQYTLARRKDVVQQERCKLAECLLYSSQVKEIGPVEAKDLFAVLRDSAREWTAGKDHVYFQIMYRLLFSLVAPLVLEMWNDGMPKVLSGDGAFKKDFGQLIMNMPSSSREVDGLFSLVRLIFGFFLAVTPNRSGTGLGPNSSSLAAEDTVIKACHDAATILHAFRFLVDNVFQNLAFQDDDTEVKSCVCTIFNGFLTVFFRSGRSLLISLRDAALTEVQTTKYQFAGQSKTAKTLSPSSEAFLASLEVVGQAYRCAPKVMNQSSDMWDFVTFAGEEHRSHRTATPFLNLLAALATEDHGAEWVFDYLNKSGSQQISWLALFDKLEVFHKLFEVDQRGKAGAQQSGLLVSGVIQEDIDMLEAYLQCLKEVMEHLSPEYLEPWLRDNSRNSRIERLFHLLQYPRVPPSLKGALRMAIGTFAIRCPTCHNFISDLQSKWELPPVAAKSVQGVLGTSQKGYDMATELTDVESRLEQYPSTLSYINLFNVLIGNLPSSTDMGRRYTSQFRFVKDHVFSGYSQRAYKDVSEKWQIAVAALRHFELMLELYEPANEGAADSISGALAAGLEGVPAPPGQEIMKDLLSGDTIYRNMMAIVTLGPETVREAVTTQAFGIHMKDAVSLCLRIFLLAFKKDLQLANSWRMPYKPLHVLLGYENRQMVALLEYVGYAKEPEIARWSIQIMSVLSERVPNLVAIIVERHAAKDLKLSYASILDQSFKASSSDDLEEDIGFLILQLCLNALGKRAPNIAHLLLGFDVELSVEWTELQHRGDFNCLNVILGEISQVEDVALHARLQEMSLELLYRLCTEQPTRDVTTNFLQTFHFDFLCDLLYATACDALPPPADHALRMSSLQQRAWLLKLLAWRLFTADPALQQRRLTDQTLLHHLFFQSPSANGVGEGAAGDLKEAKVLKLLDILLYRVPEVQRQWPQKIEAVFKELKVPELLRSASTAVDANLQPSDRADGPIDIPRLERSLWQECDRIETQYTLSLTPSDLATLREAAMEALRWAKRSNEVAEERAAQLHMAMAWAQLGQIAILKRFEILQEDSLTQPLFVVMEASLKAIASSRCSLDMAFQFSQVALAAMVKLRELTIVGEEGGANDTGDDVTVVDLLTKRRLPVFACKAILSRLVAAVLRSESSGNLRKRLYAIFLAYLQYCQGSTVRAERPNEDDDPEIGNVYQEEANLRRANFDILHAESEKLLEVIVRDASHGAEVVRTVACTLVTQLLLEGQQNHSALFLAKLESQSLLQSCLAEIERDSYQAIFAQTSGTVRQLYTREAQLGLLLQVASQRNPPGAQILLSMGALRKLGACRVLDLPAQGELDSVRRTIGNVVPTQRDRYHRIATPILQLVLSISTLIQSAVEPTMEARDEASLGVVNFVDLHEALIEHVLSDGSPVPRLEELQELALVTDILRRVVQISEVRAKWQELLYQVSLRYLAPSAESQVKHIQFMQEISGSSDPSPEQREMARLMEVEVLHVRRNMIAYLHTCVVQQGVTFHATREQVSEVAGSDRGRRRRHNRQPTLMLIAQFLKEMTMELLTAIEDKAILRSKIRDVNEVSRHEVEELIKTYGTGHAPTSTESLRSRRYLAIQEMVRVSTTKDKEISTLLFIIEKCVEILCTHFERQPHVERIGDEDAVRAVMNTVLQSVQRLEEGHQQGKLEGNVEHLRRLLQHLRACFVLDM